MLIATGPMGPLGDFLEVLCWIILPVLVLVCLFTILHHYARKRKNAANGLAEEELQLSLAGNNPEGAYLFFDHSGLIREYKNKLSYSHARYTALKKDFEKLEERYKNGSDPFKNIRPDHPKTKQMEKPIDQLQPVPSEELFLKDLVEAKKSEVAFLQEQLEQRIRKQHEMEGEKERLRTELELQLAELREQNEMLNAAAADSNEKVVALTGQLEGERSRVTAMEEKLQANKQLLQRLYKEFSACVEEAEVAPVVVPMQAAYLSSVGADY